MTYDERIAELEKQLADLKAEIKNPPGVWTPEDGEPYFSVWHTGGISKTYVPNEEETKRELSIGNCFRTKEEAKFAVERLKVLAEMRKYAKGFKPDWQNKDQNKWSICAEGWPGERKLDIECWNQINHGGPFFETKADAKACINGIGKDRLMKYYFGEEVPGDG